MTQEKLFIQNRNGEKIAVLVDHVDNPKGLAFIVHGLHGSKNEVHIQAFADVFIKNGITTVRFDSRNTFGESNGNPEQMTASSQIQDTEDIISWASKQTWYEEPFFLVAHSLGGFSIGLFAQKYPEKVRGLVPVASVVAGSLHLAMEEKNDPEALKEWRESGWREKQSKSRPGLIRRLPWSFIEDLQKYDLRPEASTLTMPVCVIVGTDDVRHEPDQRMLYDAIPGGKKEIHLVENADHNFTREGNLADVQGILDEWLKKHI